MRDIILGARTGAVAVIEHNPEIAGSIEIQPLQTSRCNLCSSCLDFSWLSYPGLLDLPDIAPLCPVFIYTRIRVRTPETACLTALDLVIGLGI